MSFRFQKFPIYSEIRLFIKKVYQLADKLPNTEKYELASQLRRAAVSISLNLAEGSAKKSDAELNRFVLIAVGSLSEIIAILDILKDLSFIDDEIRMEYTSYCENIAKQLYGFSRKLKE